MPVIADIWINDKPYMLEGNHDGLATSANPAAVGVGGGGEFKDYTQWSQLAFSSWELGTGYLDATAGGFLYGETDTRFSGKIKLAPKIAYDQIGGKSDCAAYFAEECGVIYMGYGNSLYIYSEEKWKEILKLDHCVTGLAVFDEYIHIGQGLDDPYKWYSIENGDTGNAPYPSNGFYTWGGFLYSWECNVIRYTNGGHSASCDEYTVPPDVAYDPLNPAPGWQWTEVTIGVCDACECINGLAGIYLGALGQSRLYVSTPSKLYTILPGDVVMSIADWPGSQIDNGRNMKAFNGSIYAPVGDGLFRIAGDGSIIQQGINQGEGLPCNIMGKHQDIAITNGNVLSLVDGDTPTIWAYGNGWHYIAKFPAKANGAYFSSFYERLFVPLVDGRIAYLSLVDPKSSKNRYEVSSLIDLGYVYGGLRLATKDFHDIIIDGEGITPGQAVKVYWSIDDQNGCTVPDKHLLGIATGNDMHLAWPCAGEDRPFGRKLRLWLELTTNDETKTPIVRNVILRFLPHVVDQARWHYTIALNKDCMLDSCGSEIEGYDQRQWDCLIRKAIVEVQPVKFVDYDGEEYYVKVMDWARRIHSRDVVDDQLKFDISWSLTLVQACPESLIVC